MKLRMIILFLLLASAGCATHAESVCEHIANCTTQSLEQLHTCQVQVKQLAAEASASGCSSQYESYFACADDRYECRGNIPTFDGCERSRSALDSCLEGARANNSCGQLASKLARCPSPSSTDPSAPPDPAPPAACGAAELCAARCYLDNVTDVCLPQPGQLAQAFRCGQLCPFP
jgi:hypothetical protein